jgi:hypothetical protein
MYIGSSAPTAVVMKRSTFWDITPCNPSEEDVPFIAKVDPRALVRLEGLGQLRKSNDLIGNRTHDLPACSIVPQPTTLPRAPRTTASVA